MSTLRWLRMHAPLDTTAAAAYRLPPGVQARVEVVDAGGYRTVVEGPAGPWATG